MPRKDPDKYIGRWRETPFDAISMPLAPANLVTLVVDAANRSGRYTHQQISHWCSQYWLAHEDANPVPDQLSKFAEVALEIDAQWDLYLLDTYSLEQLKALDFASVELPVEWFQDWALELRRESSNNSFKGMPLRGTP